MGAVAGGVTGHFAGHHSLLGAIGHHEAAKTRESNNTRNKQDPVFYLVTCPDDAYGCLATRCVFSAAAGAEGCGCYRCLIYLVDHDWLRELGAGLRVLLCRGRDCLEAYRG
jgi:hypothetical protein